MATWGQKTIKLPFHGSLYYQYNTTSDMYTFVYKFRDEWSGDDAESTSRFGPEEGEFIKRYIDNNRFLNPKEE